jgi:hypothetical protein
LTGQWQGGGIEAVFGSAIPFVPVGLDMIIRQNDPSAVELTHAIQRGSLEF